MKALCLLVLISIASTALAQKVEVDVEKLESDSSADSVIEIRKTNRDFKGTSKKYKITDGEEEVVGDPANLSKEARANWKKACDDWKIEFKEMNKDQHIIAANCGTPTCSRKGPESTCMSKATYKIRAKSQE